MERWGKAAATAGGVAVAVGLGVLIRREQRQLAGPTFKELMARRPSTVTAKRGPAVEAPAPAARVPDAEAIAFADQVNTIGRRIGKAAYRGGAQHAYLADVRKALHMDRGEFGRLIADAQRRGSVELQRRDLTPEDQGEYRTMVDSEVRRGMSTYHLLVV